MRHPELKDPREPMRIKGRIRGAGRRLQHDEVMELLRLRQSDPETFTYRRLAAIYEIDPTTVMWILRGGRVGWRSR